MKHELSGEAGGGILVVLVFVVIIAAIALSIMQQQEHDLLSINDMKIRGEFQDLQRYIDELIDCNKTLAVNKKCVRNSPVRIFKTDKDVLVDLPNGEKYSAFGGFEIKAECGASDVQFVLQVRDERGFRCNGKKPPCWIKLFPTPLVCD